MSFRLAVLATAMMSFLIFLLSNVQTVTVRFFVVEASLPLMFVIAIAAAGGMTIMLLFNSLGKNERKLRQKVQEANRRVQATNPGSSMFEKTGPAAANKSGK